MAKKLVRYKNVNGTLVKQMESPMLVNGLVDISQLPVVGAMGAAIIERGSNANGEYVRWADGTQICVSEINLTGINIAPDHSIWNTSKYVSPASYHNIDTFLIKPITATDDTTSGLVMMPIVGFVASRGIISMYNTGNSSQSVHPGVAIRNGGTNYIKSICFTVTTIGRWK